MSLSTIRELYQEPGCSHNEKKSDATCPRPTPGKAAGGCSFDGAFITLGPVADAAHLVHGPIACLGNAWNNRGSLSSGDRLYKIAFTTDLGNNDVVFGGEKRLYKAIKKIIDDHAPPAVFIYQTCVTSMIGDDIEAVAKAITAKTGTPVISVEAPGFTGTKNFGNRIAGNAIVEQVIGTAEPKTDHPYNINLIGEFNIAGELWEPLEIFDEIGIRVLCSLSGDARFHQIQMMHRAQVNMMVCSRALLNVARRLKEKYDIPYFEGSFYGAANTVESVRTVCRLIGDPALIARAEEVLARRYAEIGDAMAAYKERLSGKKALLYTGGVKSWSMVSAMQELGVEVVATGTKKSTEEDKARIIALMGEDATLIDEGAPKKLLALYRERGCDVMMAGGRNQYTALKAKLPFVDVNQERHIPYTGFKGHLNMAKSIALAIESRAFALAKQPDPFGGAR